MNSANSLFSLSTLSLLLAAANLAGQSEPPPWQWAHQFGGASAGLNATRVAVDDSGNSYATGSFSGTAQFGSFSLTSDAGGRDVYLMKTSPAGEVVWVRRAGGAGMDIGNSVCVDGEGNVYVAGSFEQDIAFGTLSFPGDYSSNVFLAKYGSDGDLQWARTGGGEGNDNVFAVTLDGAGNPYISGHFTDTAFFGGLPGLASAGGYDIYVAAYSASGVERWAVRAGGSGFGYEGEGGRGLAVDAAGDVYVAGNFVGTAYFGTASVRSAGSQDIFVAKYSPTLQSWEWVSRAGGQGVDFASDLEVGSDGTVYIAGVFSDTAEFGDVSLTAIAGLSWLSQDYFLASYDSNGGLAWVKQAGGIGSYGGHGIAVDPQQNVYLAATFDDTVGVGESVVTSSGYDNLYIAKFAADGAEQWVVTSGGDYFNIASDIAVDAAGSLYVAGWFLGNAHFGESQLTQESSTDLAVAKLGAALAIPAWRVDFDIRPGSAVNPLQARSRGVLPVAILGGESLDVTAIDLTSVTLGRTDGVGGAVTPAPRPGPTIEEIAAQDGYQDLSLKFRVSELVDALELRDVAGGTEVELTIRGTFLDGIEFEGTDVIRMR